MTWHHVPDVTKLMDYDIPQAKFSRLQFTLDDNEVLTLVMIPSFFSHFPDDFKSFINSLNKRQDVQFSKLFLQWVLIELI